MTYLEKATLFQAISAAAVLIVVYGGGAAILIAGVLLLPWLLAEIACGLVLVALVARLTAAYYVMRQP
jgi:hypothetical protein|nr:MAG TPA: hypothetical protein [Caudoviricetes sp.]